MGVRAALGPTGPGKTCGPAAREEERKRRQQATGMFGGRRKTETTEMRAGMHSTAGWGECKKQQREVKE